MSVALGNYTFKVKNAGRAQHDLVSKGHASTLPVREYSTAVRKAPSRWRCRRVRMGCGVRSATTGNRVWPH